MITRRKGTAPLGVFLLLGSLPQKPLLVKRFQQIAMNVKIKLDIVGRKSYFPKSDRDCQSNQVGGRFKQVCRITGNWIYIFIRNQKTFNDQLKTLIVKVPITQCSISVLGRISTPVR